MHEEPLQLIPAEYREKFLGQVNADAVKGSTRSPSAATCARSAGRCSTSACASYDGDWQRVLQDVSVFRLLLSEQDRIGIGTFQPKDEKNQDSTELTGDINYRKIAEYGSERRPARSISTAN